jgi:hypothetical protein
MAITENQYTGNGSTVLYSFTFPYLETTDIKVSLNGTVTTAYTLANATTVQFNTAPANGVAISSIRQTNDDENLCCYSSFLVLLFEQRTLMTTSPRTCTLRRSLTETPHRELQRLMLLQQRLTPLSATLVLL